MASSENLKIALLGLGRAGKFHIQSIQSIPGISLRCVVDVDESLARRLAKELECDYSTDAEGPLGQADVDAVIVASPTHEHYASNLRPRSRPARRSSPRNRLAAASRKSTPVSAWPSGVSCRCSSASTAGSTRPSPAWHAE